MLNDPQFLQLTYQNQIFTRKLSSHFQNTSCMKLNFAVVKYSTSQFSKISDKFLSADEFQNNSHKSQVVTFPDNFGGHLNVQMNHDWSPIVFSEIIFSF